MKHYREKGNTAPPRVARSRPRFLSLRATFQLQDIGRSATPATIWPVASTAGFGRRGRSLNWGLQVFRDGGRQVGRRRAEPLLQPQPVWRGETEDEFRNVERFYLVWQRTRLSAQAFTVNEWPAESGWFFSPNVSVLTVSRSLFFIFFTDRSDMLPIIRELIFVTLMFCPPCSALCSHCCHLSQNHHWPNRAN